MAEGELSGALLTAVATANEAVIVHRMRGEILWANAAVETVYGWPADDLVGANIADLVHPDDVDVGIAGVLDFAARGAMQRSPGLMRMRRKTGEYSLLEIGGNPVDLDGEQVLVTFARRAEDQSIMREATRRITAGVDVEEFLEFITQQLRWRHDAPLTVIAWEDHQGHRRTFGDSLPAALTGLIAETDEASPWRAAWRGATFDGPLTALPPHLVEQAQQHGLLDVRILPIEAEGGRVAALLTLWSDASSLPLPMYRAIAASMCELVALTLRYDEQQQQLVELAHHDGLTGLLNRRRFYEELGTLAPESGDVAVLYVDLDDFKPVNDLHGHGAGDEVLVEIGRRLRQCSRSGDLVARVGGDEFAMLCRDCSGEAAAAIARRLVEEVERPVVVGATQARVRASVGLAVGRPAAAHDLAVQADEAMYLAKRAGGHRVATAANGEAQAGP